MKPSAWMVNVASEHPEKTREVVLRIREDLYRRLEEEASRQGFRTVSEFILSIVNTVTRTPERDLSSEALEKIRAKLERFLQDELNKRLSILENIRRQVAEVYEKIDSLEQRVGEIEVKLREVESRKVETPIQPKARKTAIERLREDKILFESTLPPRIQRDRLFAYLEREGAVIIKLSKERVAIDPGFWTEFKNKLSELSTTDEKELSKVLGEKGFALWKALHNDNLIIYDLKQRRWRPVHGELA